MPTTEKNLSVSVQHKSRPKLEALAKDTGWTNTKIVDAGLDLLIADRRIKLPADKKRPQ